jgi:microcystin-dependent protein
MDITPSYPPQGKGGGGALPSGLVICWSGLIANIPAGYVICDGNNGSPNLLAKFARQVPTAATNPGSTGGADSVAVTTAQLASHTHSFNKYSSAPNSTVQTGTDGIRYISTVNSGSTGSGSAHENRPAYYELAYIMKT